MLQKITILNKLCSFESSIHQRVLKKSIHKTIKQSNVFNIYNKQECFMSTSTA